MVAIARPARTRASISLTPLIDVVFILLVFFMLASSFLEWRALEIQLPTFGTERSEAESPIRVRLAGDGTASVDGQALASEAMPVFFRSLAAEDPSRSIILVTDPGFPLQQTIAMIDRLGAAVLSNIALTSDP